MTTPIQETTFIGLHYNITIPNVKQYEILVSSKDSIGVFDKEKQECTIFYSHTSPSSQDNSVQNVSDRITQISGFGERPNTFTFEFPRLEAIRQSTAVQQIKRNITGAVSASEYIARLRENVMFPEPPEPSTIEIENENENFQRNGTSIHIQNVDFVFSSDYFVGIHTKDYEIQIHKVINGVQRMVTVVKNVNIDITTDTSVAFLSNQIASTPFGIYILDRYNNIYIIRDSTENNDIIKLNLPNSFHAACLIASHNDIFVIHSHNMITYIDVQIDSKGKPFASYRNILNFPYFLRPTLYSYFKPSQKYKNIMPSIRTIMQTKSERLKHIVILYTNNNLELFGTHPVSIPRFDISEIYNVGDVFFAMHFKELYIWTPTSSDVLRLQDITHVVHSFDTMAIMTNVNGKRQLYIGSTFDEFRLPNSDIKVDNILILQSMMHSIILFIERNIPNTIDRSFDMQRLFICTTRKTTKSRLVLRNNSYYYCDDFPKKLRYIHRPNETMTRRQRLGILTRNPVPRSAS